MALPFPFPFPFPLAPFPLPLLLPLLLPELVTAATTLDVLEAALLLLPLLLLVVAELALLVATSLLLAWLALAVEEPELEELQTVSLAPLLPVPDVAVALRARPWVTLWKFSLTSPIAVEIRITACLSGPPPAWPCAASAVDLPAAGP